MVDGRRGIEEDDMDSGDGASSFEAQRHVFRRRRRRRLQQALSKMVDWVEETSTTGRRGVHVRFSADNAGMVEAGTPYGGPVEVEEEEIVVDMEDIFQPYSRTHTSLGTRFHASRVGMTLRRDHGQHPQSEVGRAQ
ncbi:hypothetical protein BC938DRAFT_479835 [Jimgerdemannia flammicorona]|uniref:Uncharacterized protein n=1 Tax=Jimgerdemannia flammicorona TaxID=994334 RepID=A0A433QJZ7_9FUNG|nr:hypothetical protein BC938DRAFT_479835 [Jimgerdemannia flammicorona]